MQITVTMGAAVSARPDVIIVNVICHEVVAEDRSAAVELLNALAHLVKCGIERIIGHSVEYQENAVLGILVSDLRV